MIQISGLHKSFGKNQVLSNLDLLIDKPGIYAILGPNGSGKTTLIKSLLGMVILDKGKIEVLNSNVRRGWRYRDEINYLPQIANFPANLRVQELIEMIKDVRKKAGREEELIALFGLEPYLTKRLNTLSGGTRQKVNIVLAFMFDSPLIILDEPTTGLDPAALINLKELIATEKKAGKTFLVSSHIMRFVEEVADEVVYLLEGRIYFQGSLTDLKQKTGKQDFEHAIAAISTGL